LSIVVAGDPGEADREASSVWRLPVAEICCLGTPSGEQLANF
jgi:hypothetical protein